MKKFKIIAEDSGAIFPINFMVMAMRDKFKPIIGLDLKNFIFTTKGNHWACGPYMDEWDKVGKTIFSLIKKDKTFPNKVKENILRYCRELIEYSNTIRTSYLKEKSNKELWNVYNEYGNKNTNLYSWGMVPVLLDFEITNLSDALQDILKNRTNKVAEYLSILITPVEETIMKREERELLEVVARIQESKKATEIFSKEKVAKEDLNEISDIKLLMELHHKKFAWIGYGYLGPDYTIEHYIDIIRSLVKQGSAKEKLEQAKKEKENLKQRQEEIAEELILTEDEKHLFDVGREFLYLKAYRKDLLYQSYSDMHPFLEEVARRFNITVEETRYMIADEYKELLLNNKLDKQVLKQRTKQSVYVCEDGKERVLHGKEASDFIKERLKIEEIDKNISEIKGQSACPGKVTGIVKHVKVPEDMKEFNDGDILVSPATNPNLVPAMERAGAIITDEGGITCHAAIVSRELGVPCVIGTKIATKILKQGQEVEVDATNGLITVLNGIKDAHKVEKETKSGDTEQEIKVNDKFVQISSRSRLSPFPNHVSMQSITQDMAKQCGYNHNKVLMIFQDRNCIVSMLENDRKRLGALGLQKIKENPQLISKLLDEVAQRGAKLLMWTKNMHNSDLTKKTNEELAELYLKYYNEYREIYSRYFVILTIEKSLMDYLKGYLKKKVDDPETYVADLTKSTKAVHTNEETKALARLGIEIEKNNKQNIFDNELKQIKLELENHPEIKEALHKHFENFFWIPHDYEDPIWELDDFIIKLKEILKDPEKALDEIESRERETHDKIKKHEKELKIDNFNKSLFKAMRDGIHLKELRKRIVSESLYYMDSLLEEIGRRTNLDLNQVRHLLEDEVENALLTKTDYSNLAKERIKFSVYIADNGKTTAYIGKRAKELAKPILEMDKNLTEFKGYIVSPGKAKGPAKVIIHLEDLPKVKEGDVIVTIQALPPFLPYMHKAVACVNDGGTGVTSHPATLAREAGIPCLTGTKVATRAIRDGDIIEVDANDGVVKILERAGKKEIPEVEKEGEIWYCMEEIPNSHYFMTGQIMTGYAREFERYGLESLKKTILVFNKGVSSMLFIKKDFERLGKQVFEKILENPGWKRRINQVIEERTEEFMIHAAAIKNADVSRMSDEELADLYEEHLKKKFEQHFPGQPAIILEFEYQHFSSYLLDYIKKRITDKKLEYNENDVFRTLTTPDRRSFAQKEEINLLDIASEIRKDKRCTEVFMNNPAEDVVKTLPKKFPKIYALIRNHHEQFCWLCYQYIGPEYKVEYFVEVIASILKQDYDAGKKLEEIRKEFEENKVKQEKLFRELEIDEKHKELINIAKEMVFLKGYRKDGLFYATYCVEPLLKEIGKRLNLSLQEVRTILEIDMRDALSKGYHPKDVLKERWEYSLIYSTKDDVKYLSGKEARKFLGKVIIEKHEVEGVNEIKGQSACPGSAKGRVKIIHTPADMAKFNEGDILVSIATNPDVVPAMKKAAAIVTDVGGITCHAAIVSREMSKPCVIGTKIATKALKDNDLVEVDATNGMIRIVEKADRARNNNGGTKQEWKYFWKLRPYHAMIMALVSDALTKGFEDKHGYRISEMRSTFNKGISSWVMKKKEVVKACDYFMDKIMNSDFFEKNKEEVLDHTERVFRLSKEIENTNLKSLTSKELIGLFRRFKKIFHEFYVIAFIPIVLEYGGNALSDRCEEIIRSKLKKKGEEDRFADYFMALLTSPWLSENGKEELAFLKIVKKIAKSRASELFRKDIDTIMQEIRKLEVNSAIDQHIKKYDYVSYDFGHKALWDKRYYIKRISDALNEDIDRKIEEIETKGDVLSAEQERKEAELDLSGQERKMIHITRGYMGLKEHRRWALTIVIYRALDIMHEVAERVGIDKKKITYLTPDEFEEIMEKKEELRELIERRPEKSVMISSGGKSRFVYGSEADKIVEDMREIKEVEVNIDELKGTPAFSGKAYGTVRIINNIEEAKKMNKGDILVSAATSPELVPTMKKASAIVTDEGGVTCHAAIVSRELKVPCVIGTKIVTKVFKDGDYVEVDAVNGVVRKIREDIEKTDKNDKERDSTKEEGKDKNSKTKRIIKKSLDTEWLEIARRSHYPLLFWTTVGEAFRRGYLSKEIGIDQDITYYRRINNSSAFNREEWEKLVQIFKEKLEKDPQYLLDKAKEHQEKLKAILRFTDKANKNIKEKTNEELVDIYRIFVSLHSRKVGHWYLYLILMDFLPDMIAKELEQNLNEKGIKGKFNEYFMLLTNPEKPILTKKAKLNLLRIKSIIEGDRKLKLLFEKGEKTITKKIKGSKIESEIKDHLSRYFFLNGQYMYVKKLTFLDIIRKLKEIENAAEKLRETEKKDIRNAKKTGWLIKNLGFSKKSLNRIRIMRHYSWLSNYVDEVIGYAYCNTRDIITELASRYGLDYETFIEHSVYELLDLNIQPLDILNERKKDYGYLMLDRQVYIFQGDELDQLKNAESREEQDYMHIDELKGTPASPGKVKGKVRLVLENSMVPKLKEGEILIGYSTNPAFVPAMEKAAAIVVNEGGICSHAAIVSRELGVPCIVGTGIATKVFKDGDVIEVNATEGIARRAKSKTLKNNKISKANMNLKNFSEIRKTDIPLVGGKGANLGEMASIKLPVPDGFVITAEAYKRFIEETGIKDKIQALLKGLDIEDTEKLNKAAGDIKEMMLSVKIPENISEEILKRYSKINDFVAVRSSATAEDLPDASFAGQQDTFLNVKGDKELLEAVHKCFASLFTPRAIYYREKNKFDHASVYLAVVVQKMVNADKAGVIFSVNPVTNDRNEIIIEGAYGLGESVVAGELTPHSYIIDKETHNIKEKNISKQEWGYFRGEKGTEKRDIEHGHIEVLSEEEAKELTKLTKDIEKHYGIPMDIEWAIEAGKVYILQARPVTTVK